MKETVVQIPLRAENTVPFANIQGTVDGFALVERGDNTYLRLWQYGQYMTCWEMPIDLNELELAVRKLKAVKEIR